MRVQKVIRKNNEIFTVRMGYVRDSRSVQVRKGEDTRILGKSMTMV